MLLERVGVVLIGVVVSSVLPPGIASAWWEALEPLPLRPVSAGAPMAQAATGAQGDERTEEGGLPVTSPVVRRVCGSCHPPDANNRMSRISGRRTTPEGWEQTIRRMVLLNGVVLEPDVAREVVRYLSNHHGLAPEEAIPAAFEVERRLIDHRYEADAATETTCIQCHSMGRVISQRRTREEWELLMAMHRGYYPLADTQSFANDDLLNDLPGAVSDRSPVEQAIDHLADAFPLHSAAWIAWSANVRPPRLAGEWLLAGQAPGRGRIFGRVRVTAKPGAPDEFETTVIYRYARTGAQVVRTGDAIVYTGFQWRGRSVTSDAAGEMGGVREVMFVDRAGQSLTGRWFTGAYDEIGLDVTLTRLDADPAILGVSPMAVRRTPATHQVQVYGAGLAGVEAGEVTLGDGVEVTRVISSDADGVLLEVQVAPDAVVAPRDLVIGAATLPDALVVYDAIQSVRVTPQAGMARVGGVIIPKQLQQFEARGFHHGPDGLPDTADDLPLGLIDVDWSLEEYAATFDDDDIAFVGEIDRHGLFTPAEDGPNPDRSGHRNNIGDVWVVATVDDGVSAPLRGRAHLLVTVPLYMRWGEGPIP